MLAKQRNFKKVIFKKVFLKTKKLFFKFEISKKVFENDLFKIPLFCSFVLLTFLTFSSTIDIFINIFYCKIKNKIYYLF